MLPKYFATKNPNKLREVRQILGNKLDHLELDLVEIQHLDVVEVAAFKAREAYQKFGQPVLVEDTGLYFEAWNGLPGAFIKWFLDRAKPEGILKMLGDEPNRRATACAIFAFFDGKQTHLFKGEVHGKIADHTGGNNGFGFDKFFIPDGYTQTFAEMGEDQKNKISHRRKALDQLADFAKAE